MAIEYQRGEDFSALGVLKRRGKEYFSPEIYAGSTQDVIQDMENFLHEFLKGDWDFKVFRLSTTTYGHYAKQLISHHEKKLEDLHRLKKKKGIEYIANKLEEEIRKKNKLKKIVNTMPTKDEIREELHENLKSLDEKIIYLSDGMDEKQFEKFCSQILLPSEPGEINIDKYPYPTCVKDIAKAFRVASSSEYLRPTISSRSKN